MDSDNEIIDMLTGEDSIKRGILNIRKDLVLAFNCFVFVMHLLIILHDEKPVPLSSLEGIVTVASLAMMISTGILGIKIFTTVSKLLGRKKTAQEIIEKSRSVNELQ